MSFNDPGLPPEQKQLIGCGAGMIVTIVVFLFALRDCSRAWVQ